MNRTESGIILPNKDIQSGIIKEEIFEKFGFDYRPVILERLEYWKNLPKGHKINFFDVAIKHEKSSGLYLVEEIVGTSWVFVQAMLENGISTEHKHKDPVIELYDPQAGQSLLNVDGIAQELNPGIPFEVLSEQTHFLKTEGKPCLNLLIMKNSAHIPRSKLHIPVR